MDGFVYFQNYWVLWLNIWSSGFLFIRSSWFGLQTQVNKYWTLKLCPNEMTQLFVISRTLRETSFFWEKQSSESSQNEQNKTCIRQYCIFIWEYGDIYMWQYKTSKVLSNLIKDNVLEQVAQDAAIQHTTVWQVERFKIILCPLCSGFSEFRMEV